MTISWTYLAKESFEAEAAFVFKKWNIIELEKFYDLVDKNINILKNGILLGVCDEFRNITKVVISKQTSLIYRFEPHNKTITLLLFWNNQKNPAELFKILNQF